MRNTAKLLFVSFLAVVANVSDAFSQQRFNEQRHDYIQGVLTENTQSLTAHHHEFVELMLQGNPTITGVAHTQLYFAALFQTFDVEAYEREAYEFLDMGDKTAEVGRYHLRMKNLNGKVRELSGSYLNIWQEPDGSQPSLVVDFWNFDHHVDFSAVLQFDSVPSTINAYEPHMPINTPASMELAAYDSLIKESVLVRDGAVLSQLYTEDGLILGNSRPPIVGGKNITNYWEKHAKELSGFEGLQQRTVKLEDLGKYIIQHAAHIAIWRSGEYSGVNTGKHIRIWERQSDGRIKTRILASAYDK